MRDLHATMRITTHRPILRIEVISNAVITKMLLLKANTHSNLIHFIIDCRIALIFDMLDMF